MSSKRLLCVADSRAATSLFQESLTQFGFEVHTLNDPRQTMSALNDMRFDWVLLDYEMPEFDGPAVC